MADLTACLQALPQELQDLILEAAMWQGIEPVTTVDRSYYTPLGLQISSGIRRTFAREYYKNTIFTFNQLQSNNEYGSTFLLSWLCSLPPTHHRLLCRVNYHRDMFCPHARNVEKTFGNMIRLLHRIAAIPPDVTKSFLWTDVQSAPGLKQCTDLYLPASGNREWWTRAMAEHGFYSTVKGVHGVF